MCNTEVQSKGTTQSVNLGRVYIGELMTWPDAPLVRFFFRTEKDFPICKDFESKEAFEVWMEEQAAPGTLGAAR